MFTLINGLLTMMRSLLFSQHMFWTTIFQSSCKNNPQNKNNRGGSRRRAAVWASNKSTGSTHEWHEGRPPYTASLSAVANGNGHSGRAWRVMWCSGPDAHWLHRTVTLMISAAFLWAEPSEALEVQRRRKLRETGSQKTVRERQKSLPPSYDNTIRSENLQRKPCGVTERGQGDWISISFTIPTSLWLNYMGFVLKKIKIRISVVRQTCRYSRDAKKTQETRHPLWGSLAAVQRQSFSWVAKDNEVVTLDWGRKSVVFQCRPFMLRNNQYGNPLSVLHEILGGKQEQGLLSQCLQPLLTRHTLCENTHGRWIHKYIWWLLWWGDGEDRLWPPGMPHELCIPKKGAVVNWQ